MESEIRGDVTIGKMLRLSSLQSEANYWLDKIYSVYSGPRTVVHPKARIIAEAGPIVIGEGNLIEEQALIING